MVLFVTLLSVMVICFQYVMFGIRYDRKNCKTRRGARFGYYFSFFRSWVPAAVCSFNCVGLVSFYTVCKHFKDSTMENFFRVHSKNGI